MLSSPTNPVHPPPTHPRQIKHCLRPVEPGEYDAAAQNNPSSCPLAETGDARSGSELLRDAAADMH